MSTSPWTSVPEKTPYVLSEDLPHIEAWNETSRGRDDRFRLRTDLLPDPFLGPRNAPIVFLGRNPGFEGSEVEDHKRPYFASAIRGNLSDEKSQHVLFYLTEKFADTAGGRWWRKSLRQLERSGASFEGMARRILAIEFHGYHSRKWTSLPITLPSQSYGFALVKEAMERRAIIIVTRGVDDWDVAVPGLRKYEARFSTLNRQNASVSEGNLPSGVFARLLDAVSQT